MIPFLTTSRVARRIQRKKKSNERTEAPIKAPHFFQVTNHKSVKIFTPGCAGTSSEPHPQGRVERCQLQR